MLLENIRMGRTLEIYVEREGYRYRLVSKVEDSNPKRICVSLIAANGRVFRFLPEDSIRLVYRDDDNMWEWQNVKGGIAKLDDEPVHFFEIQDKGKSFNRRNAYRVPIGDEITLSFYKDMQMGGFVSDIPLPEDGAGKEEDEATLAALIEEPEILTTTALVKDISENGIGLFSNFEFNTEDSMFFSLPSPYGALESKAIIVRKDEMKTANTKYNYYYGAIFTQAHKDMMRYIYDIQRELLKKQREKR